MRTRTALVSTLTGLVLLGGPIGVATLTSADATTLTSTAAATQDKVGIARDNRDQAVASLEKARRDAANASNRIKTAAGAKSAAAKRAQNAAAAVPGASSAAAAATKKARAALAAHTKSTTEQAKRESCGR